MLTRKEVMDQVRTLTFRVSVKAADYEAALKPEVWPYRVGVRHYRAPRRTDTSWDGQLGQQGGGDVQGGVSRGGGGAATRSKQSLPPGHPRYGGTGQQQHTLNRQQVGQIDVSNIYYVLASLGSDLGSPRF